jgi:tRNA(adenine34) deaminase
VTDLDERFMQVALDEAKAAAEAGDVPVGAVVVRRGSIIGRGHNQREALADPTAHAEVIAISAAAAHVGHWRLLDCTLYVTLEPCVMCAGAIILARLERVVFGTEDPKAGAFGSLYSIHDDDRLNHRVPITPGVMANECGEILRNFFRQRRLTL